jgi:membrane associated rhomboid family serine protease
MFSFLNNIPQVTKNILILNVLVYIVYMLLIQMHAADNLPILSTFSVVSPNFEPYQVITHMFMHSLESPFHLLINMLILVMFGSHLERVWGSKFYFIFYIACGLGSFILYNGYLSYQIFQIGDAVVYYGGDITAIKNLISNGFSINEIAQLDGSYAVNKAYFSHLGISMAGASGAIFGLAAAFAYLFPNTELMLLFPPIPIKAKFLIGGYILFEVYNSFTNPNDSTAHLAHVGGALVGLIIVIIRKKTNRTNFW